jgi:hypothetical protein
MKIAKYFPIKLPFVQSLAKAAETPHPFAEIARGAALTASKSGEAFADPCSTVSTPPRKLRSTSLWHHQTVYLSFVIGCPVARSAVNDHYAISGIHFHRHGENILDLALKCSLARLS